MWATVGDVHVPEPEDGTSLVRERDGDLDLIWRADYTASREWQAGDGERWFWSCDEAPVTFAAILQGADDVYELASLRDQAEALPVGPSY